MSDNIDERPGWDETLAKNVVGKVVLVGLKYLEADGTLIEQEEWLAKGRPT